MDDFIGSIAQNNVQYIIQESYNTNPGAQYQKVMIFVGESDASTYFVGTPPSISATLEVNSTNYATLTAGKLKLWLADFFAGTLVATVVLTVWDDGGGTFAVTALPTTYTAVKTKAYFKTRIASILAHEVAAFVELCTTAVGDDLFTQSWLGTADATVAMVATILAVANADAKIVYHSDTNRNPALVQLGLTLSEQNLATGFCVGNSLFFVYNTVIDASGTASGGKGTNITSVLRSTLEGDYVSFFTYVGDGTGATAMEHGWTIRNKNAAAKWVEAFIEFVGAVKTTQQITQMNTWRNNNTYQAILLIMTTLLNEFATLGRFANIQITAPNFNNLPSGSSIVVPNAWSAQFVDSVEVVTIYGTLYITSAG
jgi:hypothetical protein